MAIEGRGLCLEETVTELHLYLRQLRVISSAESEDPTTIIFLFSNWVNVLTWLTCITIPLKLLRPGNSGLFPTE